RTTGSGLAPPADTPGCRPPGPTRLATRSTWAWRSRAQGERTWRGDGSTAPTLLSVPRRSGVAGTWPGRDTDPEDLVREPQQSRVRHHVRAPGVGQDLHLGRLRYGTLG